MPTLVSLHLFTLIVKFLKLFGCMSHNVEIYVAVLALRKLPRNCVELTRHCVIDTWPVLTTVPLQPHTDCPKNDNKQATIYIILIIKFCIFSRTLLTNMTCNTVHKLPGRTVKNTSLAKISPNQDFKLNLVAK